jgi:hypothetical protein
MLVSEEATDTIIDHSISFREHSVSFREHSLDGQIEGALLACS